MGRLSEIYKTKVVLNLLSEFGIKNVMQAPRVVKVVLNVGVGEAARNKQLLEDVRKDLSLIAGQSPQVRPARKSVASFGIRKGMPVGLKVTLRGERMYSFLDKLFSIVLTRLRDFKGVSEKNFDKNANYTLGFADYTIFPEVQKTGSHQKGLEVTIVTNTKDKVKSKRLLELLGMPFEKK